MKKINLKLVASVLFIVAIVGSAALVYQNRIFNFSEFNDSVQVTFTKGDEKIPTAIDKLKADTRISKIDRETKTVYFQRAGIDEIKNYVTEALKDDKDVVYQFTENVTLTSNREVLIDYAIAISIVVIIALGALFYFVLRYFKKWQLIDYEKFFAFYILISIVTVELLIGILSLLSKFYEINSLDLSVLLVVNLLIFSWFFISVYNLKTKELTVSELLFHVSSTLREYFMTAMKIAVGVLVIISFGLGANYVITAALIFVAIILSFFVPFEVNYLYSFMIEKLRTIKMPEQKLSILKPAAKQEFTSVQPATPHKASKKKDKKKKKKK